MPRIGLLALTILSIPSWSFCQQTSQTDPPVPEVVQKSGETDAQAGRESKRIFGIVPNYRTSASLANYKPLTTKEKFSVATQDAFDRGTFALAAIFAAESQLTDANHSFGQGMAGYGKYLGTSYGDLLIGDYMTEAIFPTFLHQDPRYFRKGTGSGLARLGYAIGQIVVTHGDSGRTQFNFSEILGNATAVAISNAYYVDNRNASDNVSKLGMQLGVDAASNVLKEFWPDVARKFGRKHDKNKSTASNLNRP